MKWRQSPPLMAFLLSPASVYLFVGDRRWKEGLWCQVNEWCNVGLGRVKSFLCSGSCESGWFNCRRLPTPFDFFFVSFSFWMSSSACSFSFPPSFMIFDIVLFITSCYYELHYFNSYSLNFSCVYFSHCPLFSLFLSSFPLPIFTSVFVDSPVCQLLSLSPYTLRYWCLTQTKGCSPGLDASQVSLSLLPDPWRFQIH